MKKLHVRVSGHFFVLRYSVARKRKDKAYVNMLLFNHCTIKACLSRQLFV